MLKMKLVPGKALFFVNDIARGFKLKLFLERFCIKAAILNSELPQNSRFAFPADPKYIYLLCSLSLSLSRLLSHIRLNIIQQFNKGVFDYLVATDEKSTRGLTNKTGKKAAIDDEDPRKGKEKEGARKRKREDKEGEQQQAEKEKGEDDEGDEDGEDKADGSEDDDDEENEEEEEEGVPKVSKEDVDGEEDEEDDEEDISFDKGADTLAGDAEEDGGEADFFGGGEEKTNSKKNKKSKNAMEEDDDEDEENEEDEEEEEEKEKEEEEEEEEDGETAEERALKEAELKELTKKQRKLNRKQNAGDSEYGVSRGVDFKGVKAGKGSTPFTRRDTHALPLFSYQFRFSSYL